MHTQFIHPYAAPGVINYSPSCLTIETIEKYVCQYYQVEPASIHVRSRRRNLVEVRQMIYFLCRDMGVAGVVDLGRFFGHDHTSDSHNVQAFRDRYDTDENVRRDTRNIKYQIHYRMFG